MKSVVIVWSLLLVEGLVVSAFDLKLDTQKDKRRWTFHGSHEYLEKVEPGSQLAPLLLPTSQDTQAEGIWYFKHAPPTRDNDNYNEISYALKHQLFQQVWVKLLAHPSVTVVIKSAQNVTFGSFVSTGTEWCDALFNIDPTTQVKVTMELNDPDTYAMIDKVVFGVNANITSLNGSEVLNPCQLAPTKNSGTLTTSISENPNLKPEELRERTTTTVATTTTTVAPPMENQNQIEKVKPGVGTLNTNETNNNNNSSILQVPESVTNSNNSTSVGQLFIPTVTTTTNQNAQCHCSCSCSS